MGIRANVSLVEVNMDGFTLPVMQPPRASSRSQTRSSIYLERSSAMRQLVSLHQSCDSMVTFPYAL